MTIFRKNVKSFIHGYARTITSEVLLCSQIYVSCQRDDLDTASKLFFVWYVFNICKLCRTSVANYTSFYCDSELERHVSEQQTNNIHKTHCSSSYQPATMQQLCVWVTFINHPLRQQNIFYDTNFNFNHHIQLIFAYFSYPHFGAVYSINVILGLYENK